MRGAKILVVDDNIPDARLCQMLLEQHNFFVVETTDPRKALDCLKSQRFDLLLVDIYLPHIDGFELISQAKVLQPGLAVLVMTGFGTVQTGIQALQRGVDGLILKPFDTSDRLIEAVQQAMLLKRHKDDAVRLQVIRPLFSVTEGLIAETYPAHLYRLILNAAEELFPNACICIYRWSENESQFVCLAANESDCECSDPDFIRRLRRIADHNGAMLVVEGNDDQAAWRQTLGEYAHWSFMITTASQATTRFLFLAGRSENAPGFTESELEMFVLLARQAAIAIINAGLHEELRMTIKQVEESQRALVQSEKMAAVGRLIASVAHEINNPLQAIGNCLHLAGRKDLDAAQRAAYLQLGKDELDRLMVMTRQMLDYYRIDNGEREPVDIRELVDRALDLLQGQLSAHSIQVHRMIRKPLPPLPLAKNQMLQVLVNLLLNSIDATQGNPTSRSIWLEACMQNQHLLLSIEDNGSGIPPEYEHRVFEPFFSTKPDGMGLGLMISYSIVEVHGGTLQLAPSSYGVGAKFQITIPYGV